jgi:hypothetical protein
MWAAEAEGMLAWSEEKAVWTEMIAVKSARLCAERGAMAAADAAAWAAKSKPIDLIKLAEQAIGENKS